MATRKEEKGSILGSLVNKVIEPMFDNALGNAQAGTGQTVAVIRLEGAIMAGGGGGLGGAKTLNLKSLRPTIKEQFNKKGLVAVALSINSPGGSPVQSDLIAREIRALADKKKIPVFTFVEDVAASGGYWLACAGDEIYALPSSITGSIGVISASFGFDKLIGKLGVERRVITSGANKSQLDPFKPQTQKDVDKVKDLQGKIHDDFKDWVKSRRGAKLKSPDPALNVEDGLMNGDFWTTKDAMKFGLVDKVGELEATMRQKFGESVNIDYGSKAKPSIFQILQELGGGARTQAAGSIGADAVDQVLHRVEERALWKRFGL